MGEVDAAGDVVTAGLIGRAVEPRAGEHASVAEPGACLNCGTRLIGEHCHACGQAGHVHRTMSAIGHDIAHGVFHFEGKIWRTLPMLAFHPGELTRRYIAGERARFVSPMALFLFSVFLMFTVVANLPGWSLDKSDLLTRGFAAGLAQARTGMAEERANLEKGAAQAGERLAAARAGRNAAEIGAAETRLDKMSKELADLATAEKALCTGEFPKSASAPVNENWFEQKIRHARENPALLLYKVKTSAYKFSWALIPISLPFVWLLFPFRRGVGLYDHAVFTTYSLTFMSLLVIVLAVLGALGVPAAALWTVAVLVPPFHIYKQLKGASACRVPAGCGAPAGC